MPESFQVTTFYRFAPVADCEALCRTLRALCREGALLGTILIAPEGVNATVSGTPEAIRALVSRLQAEPGFEALDLKHSVHAEQPFLRLKVRVRDEIITFGRPDADPGQRTGEHVDARRWNQLLADPSVTVLDTRNDYEVCVGTFRGAQTLNIGNFRDFPAAARGALDPQQQPRVAMFCTGGVRCEKAAAFLLNEGFEAVYQLDGGILRYLEQTPPAESHWQGDCFVFDERVTVDADLQAGGYRLCRGCRHPVSAAEAASDLYEPGVCCPRCHDRLGDARRQQYRERYRNEVQARARRAAGDAA